MKNTLFSLCTFLALSAAAQEQPTTTKQETVTPASQTISSDNVRPEHFLPVLGHYTTAGNTQSPITITVDEQNLGIIWIDGLPEGRFKALLKQRPSTYKIPAQKSESGKQVSEGTLYFDAETSQLAILIGRPFNDENPISDLNADTKSKTKVSRYTAVKDQH